MCVPLIIKFSHYFTPKLSLFLSHPSPKTNKYIYRYNIHDMLDCVCEWWY